MADIDITVDFDDLKKAGLSSEQFMQQWSKMVAKIATDNKRLEATSKQSAQVQIKAVQDTINQGILRKEKAEAAAAAKRSSLLKKQATEEARTASQIKSVWQNYYTTLGQMQGTGAPTSVRNSVLVQQLELEEEQARQTALALQEEANEIERLTQKYAPATIAARRFEIMQEEVRQAMVKGVVTAEQMEAALERLKAEYAAFNSGVMLAGSRFNDLTQTGLAAGRSLNRFGMYAQQAGYQIGDFAVQVQMGTNVGVAFAQQAAQLAGLLPGLTGALTAFAAIGLGIFIQYMTSSKTTTKEANEELEKLGATLDRLEQIQMLNITEGLSSGAQKAREEFETILDIMERVEIRTLREQITAPIEAARSSIEEYLYRSNISGRLGTPEPTFNVMGFDDLERFIQYAEIIREINGSTKEELQEQIQLAAVYLRGSGLLTAEAEEQLNLLAQQVGLVETLNSRIDSTNASLQSQLDLLREGSQRRAEYNERLAEAAAFYVQEAFSLIDQLALQQKVNQYGQDSVQVLDEIRMQELARYEIQLRQQNLNQEQIDALLMMRASLVDAEQATARSEIAARKLKEVYERSLAIMQNMAGVNLEAPINAATSAARRLLGNLQAVMGALGQIGRIGMSNAALAAENAALASGASPGMARVEGQMVEFDQSISQLPQWQRTILGIGQRAALTQNLRLDEENSALTSAWDDANSSTDGGAGGGGGGSVTTDHIAQLTREIEQRQRLIGVYGEQQRYLENYIEVENRLGEDRANYTEQQISEMAALITQMETNEDRWNSLFNTFSSNIESALMNIVTGSDSVVDAFKGMMRSILLEVYQQQVAKPAANFLGNLLGNMFMANGGAFVGGRLQAYASGGVVDSPTFFNHSGGRGLMGEAGPEAILPLRRASNGKLGVQVSGGNSESIVINQSFNFSANGDESVKAIIRQESRSIVEQTKRAVVDAKRRGQVGY